MRRLLTKLYDGHARMYQKTATDIYVPHLRLSMVEDSLLVLDARDADFEAAVPQLEASSRIFFDLRDAASRSSEPSRLSRGRYR